MTIEDHLRKHLEFHPKIGVAIRGTSISIEYPLRAKEAGYRVVDETNVKSEAKKILSAVATTFLRKLMQHSTIKVDSRLRITISLREVPESMRKQMVEFLKIRIDSSLFGIPLDNWIEEEAHSAVVIIDLVDLDTKIASAIILRKIFKGTPLTEIISLLDIPESYEGVRFQMALMEETMHHITPGYKQAIYVT